MLRAGCFEVLCISMFVCFGLEICNDIIWQITWQAGWDCNFSSVAVAGAKVEKAKKELPELAEVSKCDIQQFPIIVRFCRGDGKEGTG